MRFLFIIVLWVGNFSITFAQNEVIYKEMYLLYYEEGKIPCSKGLRWDSGKCYYMRCEYGTEAQKKKLGSGEIEITTNLEVRKLFKELSINDLEWLSGITTFHQKKYKCKNISKMAFSITLKDKGKKKTTRYDFPLVLDCEGKSPFNLPQKLNLIFNKLAKEFP
jgi:hypothetical protein